MLRDRNVRGRFPGPSDYQRLEQNTSIAAEPFCVHHKKSHLLECSPRQRTGNDIQYVFHPTQRPVKFRKKSLPQWRPSTLGSRFSREVWVRYERLWKSTFSHKVSELSVISNKCIVQWWRWERGGVKAFWKIEISSKMDFRMIHRVLVTFKGAGYQNSLCFNFNNHHSNLCECHKDCPWMFRYLEFCDPHTPSTWIFGH